jgi:hypothetical protein
MVTLVRTVITLYQVDWQGECLGASALGVVELLEHQ